jgi:hypothetical protein
MKQASEGGRRDLEAMVNASLEDWSEYTDFTALKAEDNSDTLFLGSPTLMLIGDRQYPVTAGVAN